MSIDSESARIEALKASGDISTEASGNISNKASGNMTIKGGANTTVEAGGVLEEKGTTVKIN